LLNKITMIIILKHHYLKMKFKVFIKELEILIKNYVLKFFKSIINHLLIFIFFYW